MPEPTLRPMTRAEVSDLMRYAEERRDRMFGDPAYDARRDQIHSSLQWLEIQRDILSARLAAAETRAAQANRLHDLNEVIDAMKGAKPMLTGVVMIWSAE